MNPGTASNLSVWQIWLLAARPRTLPAAAAPVLVGCGVAVWEGVFRPLPALAAFLVGLLLQIGANISNDYFDFKKGADTSERIGPLRVTQAGLLTPRQVIGGMLVVFGAAALIGLYLIWVAGLPALILGVVAILSALAYTGGPYPLAYHGWGEVFVLLFFGFAAVGGTYFVQAGSVSAAALVSSLPVGLLAMAILTVNNLRDIATDRASGKHTLAVRLGEQGAVIEYGVWVGLAYGVALMGVISRILPVAALLSLLSLPLAARLIRQVAHTRGRGLNVLLGKTGQLELLFAVLFTGGLLISRWWSGF
ncbi:1,4-dihydroxy-2-naphthoate prenyltransferase [Bellilinea caldifistulae]|uniref:1,4-dihydroxy-2-naphthoate octaprenyltransferase n=1 Tax=Bellilinea caldifistulae TaxID=360411 RepID=A0A0P6XU08_9CHLR|nr:1,4-dihydroxy-2-naphthoate polyprenyltransferase [Bellilinea caldifistulae]KPL78611.1 1,4-dihydroxy-2-naphthoate prenyltransferase [Bellilinea caldifistulae]GAP09450.1 1,4-dihydroxy-2-naphthoate prenyltransferase [Bellilinea caldifistulae]